MHAEVFTSEMVIAVCFQISTGYGEEKRGTEEWWFWGDHLKNLPTSL